MLPLLRATAIIQAGKIVLKYTCARIWFKTVIFYGLHWSQRELTSEMYMFGEDALYVLLLVCFFFLFDNLNHMSRYLEDYFIRNSPVWEKYRAEPTGLCKMCTHSHTHTHTHTHTHS
jgi:hypothetical protein